MNEAHIFSLQKAYTHTHLINKRNKDNMRDHSKNLA